MRREMQSVRLRGKIDFFFFFFPRFEKKERERDFVSPGCRRNSMTLETKEKQETRGRGGGGGGEMSNIRNMPIRRPRRVSG